MTPDICVIGAGSGGLSVAAAAAMFGVSVVLVERDRMGGDCLNVGCVPSKALIAAGARAQAIREAGRFGVGAGEPQVSYAQVHDHVQRVIGAIAPNDSVERFGALGVTVINGEARFASRSTVVVGEQVIKARRFVIATGSRPSAPPIPGLSDVPYLTNESVFELTKLPARLLVLGGGPIGVELAQAMARLGSAVTIVEAQTLLSRDDPEAAAIVRRRLLREGVTLKEKATVLRAETIKGGVRLVLAGSAEGAEDALDGTHLLVAAGRKPNIEALDLDLAGVSSDARGVIVDKGLRTANRRIYAIGDCASGQAGALQFTHVANYHAGLVLRSALFRLPVKVSTNAIPRVTYCHPELASVGLSEDEARKAAGEIRVLRWPYAENDRAQAERETEGFVKVVTTKKGRILGVTIVGAQAGDMIVPWCMAVQKGFGVKDMAGLVFPYPTFSEVSKRAAVSFYAPLAAKPGIRKLIGFLRRFG
ncbi:MAG: FAD-dependent oxidoreductase [Beijerinckiaceae bacterium]|nr:FAD-dependent oxidoreductase [Beijerinckiaceae bacterium]